MKKRLFFIIAVSANTLFDSTLKLDHYDFTLFYGVPALKTATKGKVNAEFGLNLRILDFKGEIRQTSLALAQSKSLTIPIPMGYVGLQIHPIESLKIETEGRVIAYGNSRYVDVSGRLKYIFLEWLFVSGGYKYQNIKIDQSDVNTDLRFGGPTAELGVEF